MSPGEKVLSRRATGWPWLSCNDRPGPPACVGRLAAAVERGDLDPAEAVRRLRAVLGAAEGRVLDYLKAVHDLGEAEADDMPLANPFAPLAMRERQAGLRAVQRGNQLEAKLHLCRGALAEAAGLEEAVRSTRARYGGAATPILTVRPGAAR